MHTHETESEQLQIILQSSSSKILESSEKKKIIERTVMETGVPSREGEGKAGP